MAENKNQEVHYRAIQPNEWIENVFTEAIMRGASDIHIEPSRQELKVRLRIE